MIYTLHMSVPAAQFETFTNYARDITCLRLMFFFFAKPEFHRSVGVTNDKALLLRVRVIESQPITF